LRSSKGWSPSQCARELTQNAKNGKTVSDVGVNKLTGLLDKKDAKDASIDKSTDPVVPEDAGNSGWEDEAHDQRDFDVVAVLPDNNSILIEVGDVGSANTLWVFCISQQKNYEQ
jgi:hypothetical protein